MKANELRLGNYIYVESDWRNHQTKTKTRKVSLTTISEVTRDGNDISYKPIPLTEEWLLKFGFYKHPIHDYCYKGCGEYEIQVVINAFSGTLKKEPSWFVSIQTGYGSQPVTLVKQYIHELHELYVLSLLFDERY